MSFAFLTAVNINISVFFDVMTGSLVQGQACFF
jgi:hypothetical protein